MTMPIRLFFICFKSTRTKTLYAIFNIMRVNNLGNNYKKKAVTLFSLLKVTRETHRIS